MAEFTVNPLRFDPYKSHMFRIQWVPMLSTVHAPQMIEMQFDFVPIPLRSHGKRLPIDRPIVGFRKRYLHIRAEPRRSFRAIMRTNLEHWHKLLQQPLLQRVAQSICIRVRVRDLSRHTCVRNQQQDGKQSPGQTHSSIVGVCNTKSPAL